VVRLIFRTEGNHQQGMGDVMGCVAMAEHCRESGDAVLFLISEGAEAVAEVESRGYTVRIATTLDEQLAAIRRFDGDAVVVNMLNTPAETIRALKSATPMVVTIDDSGAGALAADLRVNVLYHVTGAVTDPGYIALRSEFQLANRTARTTKRDVAELLAMQGGADTYGFLPKIVAALALAETRPHVTVICGPAFRHERELDDAISRSPLNISVLRNCREMADVMSRADLAITAGGISMFELACVGTPAIVVCAERWEVETADRLQSFGIVRNLGFGADVAEASIADAVDDLARNFEARKTMSELGRRSVDAGGARRVIDLIRKTVAERRSLA
jgi:spore coat polysaccharide biosynthesis predicted glycosyltransferase SpsG